MACEREEGREEGREERRRRPLRSVVGILLAPLLAGLVWLWLHTLRLVVVDGARAAVSATDTPWVLAFFHGTQVPLLAWKRRRTTVVMVSWSSDGAIQARLLGALGMVVVRGSTSRGAARGLLSLVRRVRGERLDAAFAVDGPRGPYGVVQPGAQMCARLSHGHIVPIGSACAHALVLTRAWDRMALPLPFTRVVVAIGAPLAHDVDAETIRKAIVSANETAVAALT